MLHGPINLKNQLDSTISQIYFCNKTTCFGRRNCPKHVEFYSKNKLEKMLHVVGFIIRIYHDARSAERQINKRPSAMKSARNRTSSYADICITINQVFNHALVPRGLCDPRPL